MTQDGQGGRAPGCCARAEPQAKAPCEGQVTVLTWQGLVPTALGCVSSPAHTTYSPALSHSQPPRMPLLLSCWGEAGGTTDTE